MKNLLIPVSIGLFFLSSCKKDEIPEDPLESKQIEFSLKFDETLPRLGNFGEEVEVAAGNAAQHPEMEEVSVHYIEFAPNATTPLGAGQIVYKGTETEVGGAAAVDFDKAPRSGEDELFLSVDLTKLAPGTYTWLRVSLTYQKYVIQYRYNNPPYFEDLILDGTLASFVGFNTYIKSHTIKDSVRVVNANKAQGYWAFETGLVYAGVPYGSVSSGDGAGVTVVNPISGTSPVPPGSCVVTGELREPLVITGNETDNVQVVLAFSINNSFEWEEVIEDGLFEPGEGERVVDMGLRGLHPYVK